MKQNIQKTIELIPIEVLSDIFLKNLHPQQFLIKEMGKVMQALYKTWLKKMGTENIDESVFGNKQEDFTNNPIAFNINFGYVRGELPLIGDKIHEFFAWDGNINDIAEKYLFFARNSSNLIQIPMQLQMIDFDKYDRNIRFKEILEEYPFFKYYTDISEKEMVIKSSKIRLNEAESKIATFFQVDKHNHIDKFTINYNRQIRDINFKFVMHFWLVGPLNNKMNLVNTYFSKENLNTYEDWLFYNHFKIE